MTLLDTKLYSPEDIVLRHDWTLDEINDLLEQPLIELLWNAQLIHRIANPGYKVQLASLLSVKTGGCQEDCAYCSQSMHNSSDVSGQPNLDVQPESVPINKLVRVKGTPFSENQNVDDFDFIRIIALARIVMPYSMVRLSAGRDSMNDQTQALCFFAGANSIFYGEELLTTRNSSIQHDQELMRKLKIGAL
mgnify:CR=1 FL=1